MWQTIKELLTGKPVASWGIAAVAFDAASVVWAGVELIDFGALLTSGLTLFYGGKLLKDQSS
jgi:hypothetical protein